MILYINSCVRSQSRTDRLARVLLKKLKDDIVELKIIDENMLPLDEDAVEYRNHCIEEGRMTDPVFFYAKQFATADTIVISAPFWDYSFPALLKIYIENICVPGITFKYNELGMSEGLCRAGKVYFVTTSGGPFFGNYGFEYIKALCTQQFGIQDVSLIMAENFDVEGADVEKLLKDASDQIMAM